MSTLAAATTTDEIIGVVVLSSVLLLVVVGVAGIWFRSRQGYRAVSLTCYRIRRSNKAALISSKSTRRRAGLQEINLDEVDVDSDSDDDGLNELSPVHLSRTVSASDFASPAVAAEANGASGRGNQLLLQIPLLWSYVLSCLGILSYITLHLLQVSI